MGREIKFRAWDLELKQYRSAGTIQMSCGGKLFLLIPIRNNFLVEKIDKIVLEQFTGLHDKQGVNYCEGDIIEYHKKNYRLIKGTYQFELVGFYNGCQDNPSDFFSEEAYKFGEIIGNIYESPELLDK